MISEEDFQGCRAAQKAIDKLEADGSISVNSPEHQALVWAVVRLSGQLLFDNRPLTPAELEKAQQVIASFRKGN